MDGLRSFALFALLSLTFHFNNVVFARHIYSLEKTLPEEFDDVDDEFVSAKFRPEEIKTFLKSLHQHQADTFDEPDGRPPLKFAEVSPDVLLERLIDEADQERKMESTAQRLYSDEDEGFGYEEKKLQAEEGFLENNLNIDNDLNDTL